LKNFTVYVEKCHQFASKIEYYGTPILVDRELFAAASTVFSHYYDPSADDGLKFQEFLAAVQGRPSTITDENIARMRILGGELVVADLIAACDRFVVWPIIGRDRVRDGADR
jgi:hypothetical protein